MRGLTLPVLVAAAAVACNDAPSEPASVVDGVRVTTAVDRTMIRASDTVRLRVVARNVGDTVIRLPDPLVSCALEVEVRGPGPVNYYRDARLCAGASPSAAVPVVLAPGDSLVGTAVWPGVTYVSTSESVLGEEGPAPPGTYFAVGAVRLGLRAWLVGDSARVVVAAP
jgi:hypothetical protein